MKKRDYLIRTMTRGEIDIAIDWAAEEGWNPGLYDAECFYTADDGGFLIGKLGDEPISSISVVKYGDEFGFLGFYIVKPEYRGKGYGYDIWKAGMKRLAGRNIGLDGVVDQQNNYRKSGFKLAYRNIRYEGVSGGQPPENSSVVNLSEVPFKIVEKYDRQFFPDKRTKFLESWLNQPENIALGIIRNDKLSGYGMIRKCRNGYKIGPLFADTSEIARDIFKFLRSGVKPGEPIFLDTPEVNENAVAMAEDYNMKVVFETARMYTGKFPELPLNKLFGVTTFELG